MEYEKLPYVNVGYSNTPLEFLPNLTKEIGKGNIYIKRDDMTGLAMGGNKTRKLDYLVEYALKNGYTALLTYGGVQTNHGRLTVAAARKFGLKPILVLTGAKPDYCSGNLLLDRLMDADLIFLDTSSLENLPEAEKKQATEEFMRKSKEKIFARYAAQGEKVLDIPVGGSSSLGAMGYVHAAGEIVRQMKEQNIQARYLVAGYGSTGTFSGLVAGAKYYNAPFEVIGIPISPDYHPQEEAAAFIESFSQEYELGVHCKPEEIHIEAGPAEAPYYGVAYNTPDPITQQYIALLARTEGIFTDPCYTGKVLYGMVDLMRRGVIGADENVILLHTGGTPALWSKEHLDDMQKQFWCDDRKITVLKP